ncbi:alkene reductase [Nocardioides aromaticivorans]|uniref:Alkene reductase n=1 Tax=Nocardioides aromaticivorans TaxID=200618 RepID=A0ABX7PRZ9_9ACTN|nr:alkene reductase [Nocardioides aromaticivorans]QSR28784.1 alkene reductase [Nocardioides aromaticivorans]
MTTLFDDYELTTNLRLANRIVLPPLTRNRATDDFVPTASMAEYYRQRATAGLLVTEGVAIAPAAVAYPRVPGLWTDAQEEAWASVVEAVHGEGAVIFAQLWHVGRVSHSLTQPGGTKPVAPSPIPVVGEQIMTSDGLVPFETPRELETDEIPSVVDQYVDAARRARRAGFDGVEIHAANGYLIDQFLNDESNRRTDRYGGDIEGRLRFLLDVVAAVSDAIGAERVGVRLSPSGTWMQTNDSDKRALYGAAVTALDEHGIAYLHLVEPTIAGAQSVTAAPDAIPSAYFRELFTGTLIVAGDHTFETGTQVVRKGTADLVAFGRAFISNPDLPARFESGLPLAEADRATFYTPGDRGYIDYPPFGEGR